MARAYIEAGKHWGQSQWMLTALQRQGYTVQHWREFAGDGTGDLTNIHDITGL